MAYFVFIDQHFKYAIPASSRAQLPEELLDVIYRSTVVVLALTDVHALADFEPLLNHIKEHPHVIITCDALLMPSGEALNQVHEQLRFLLQRKQLHWPILPFHSHYAKKALELVRNPKSASNNLGLFADAFGQAGLVTVSEQLAFALRQSSAQSETSDVSLPARFIADSARGSALELNFASQTKAHEAMNALKVCSGYLASLRSNAETALGLITANGVQKLDLPESASVQGKAAMEAILAKRLNWWRLPWGRADDIYGDLAQASQSFFRDAENNVRFDDILRLPCFPIVHSNFCGINSSALLQGVLQLYSNKSTRRLRPLLRQLLSPGTGNTKHHCFLPY